jgi:CBS domain-containing protein
MRALDVMTKNVVSVSPEATVQEAARLLAENHISGMPVLDDEGHLLGILTEGDLLHRAEIGTKTRRRSWWLEWLASNRELAAIYVKENARLVRDVMTTRVISVGETTPVHEIAELMEQHGIKRVPVTYEGELLGIVSRANLIKVLAMGPKEISTEGEASDRQIRDAVLKELARHRWAAPVEDVMVSNGVVHLWGVVTSQAQARGICVAAQSVPGVKSVEDHTGFDLTVLPV